MLATPERVSSPRSVSQGRPGELCAEFGRLADRAAVAPSVYSKASAEVPNVGSFESENICMQMNMVLLNMLYSHHAFLNSMYICCFPVDVILYFNLCVVFFDMTTF